jgi:cell division protein ZapD
VILYEYPFNERIRTYLRLQHLFRRLEQLVGRDDAIDHHFALVTLFEILEVSARTELKGEVLKDIERQRQVYSGYRGNPAISEQALDALLGQLDGLFDALNTLEGKMSQPVLDNEFLNALRSRSIIPGGTCEFDLPAYHAWQHHAPELRRADLQQWVAGYAPLVKAIDMLLQMLRQSGQRQKVVTQQGVLQQNLPQGRQFQLLRMRLDPSLGLIPEISCNRLLVVIRMMRAQPDGRLQAVTEDVDFEMSLCA